MRLSWNEIRSRAAAFAEEWKDAHYEKGETQTFYNEFFEIFDVKRRRVGRYEEAVKKLDNSQGFIDLFWPGTLLVEQKSAGRDLTKAKEQAFDYLDGLSADDFPRYVLLSDFQTFELYDLETREDIRFPLADLPKHVDKFSFILGVEKRTFQDQDPVNIEASERLGRLHDALYESGYRGHDLERFLVRVLFCLFADDTGIFEPKDILHDYLKSRTREDGTDTGPMLMRLFQVLNTPEDERSNKLDFDLTRFPYVNGDLFAEDLRMPDFDAEMREILLEASSFDWGEVSPAIFGSLFQSVMDPEKRRAIGAHYTTEKNILKVIGPLFMDDLWREFQSIKNRKRQKRAYLERFHRKLMNLTFFDPACGCGNFLVIAYRELRSLEIEVLKALYSGYEKYFKAADASRLSQIDVDQFYGIELEEFPARIAEAAMWMMDHIMNNRLGLTFGQPFARIPLTKSPAIRHGDALAVNWNDILPSEECDYVFGNPPFGGAKLQKTKQRAAVREIADLGGSGGTLDYVAAWFVKAGQYVQKGHARIAFVATNSITQGEQVAQLWPILWDRYGLEIAFAHRTFAWGSEARGKAHVHVVIIGLTKRDQEPRTKRLFSYDDIKRDPVESTHTAITAYLFAGTRDNRHLVVREESRPINGLPRLIIGSKPIDGGHYIFTNEEKEEFLRKEPQAEKYFRPFIGAREYLNNQFRWILYLQDAEPSELRHMPMVRERINCVREYRTQSKSKPTQALAETPTLYHVNVIPDSPFLVIPEVSSERRKYVPIGWLEPPAIPSNLVRALVGAEKWHFGVLTSAMHMAWLRQIGGRLKSDYRYSIGLVYNTFPWPEMTGKQQNRIAALAQAVLDARAAHPGESLADLYDPDLMPANLRKAHNALDRAVDRLYRKAPFRSERERVEHLFQLYEQMISPLTSKKTQRRKRKS